MDDLLASAQQSINESELFKPRIAVVGVGGGGNNTVNRLSMMDIKGARLFAFNTDTKHLNTLGSNINRLVLGEQITHGLGAGGFPEIGERAATLSRDKIDTLLKDINLLFLTAGMGGGTGTGATPVVADIAKKNGAITIGIVTLPFSLEKVRLEVARAGVEKLRQNVDTLIIIDNQRLVSLYPNLQIEKAFALADEITARAVRGITETITQPSLITLDFADVRTIMSAGGLAMISVGTGQGADRINGVVKDTLSNKLLDVNYEDATGALLHITGGPDLTLGDANEIATKLTENVSPNANVTWGARLDENYTGKVEVIAIFVGVKSPSILGAEHKPESKGFGLDEL